MENVIIGRKEEQGILYDIMAANGSDMLAITGRRRVGKTFLVRNFFEHKLNFEFSGMLNAGLDEQLQNFSLALGKYNKKKKTDLPENWLYAFHSLAEYLDGIKTNKKYVIFIDELPWLDSHKSKFLPALDWFWNNWAVKKNVLLIICGSAASWMTSKIINNRGGLHNRVTKRLHLEPFNLQETEAYLQSKGIKLTRYSILQIYMSLGGIPHYLKEIKKGQSAAQNIHRICFSKNGLLVNEFQNLYQALFSKADQHISIVKALAAKPGGLTRTDILDALKIKDGGSFTKLLMDLEQSDFITFQPPFDKIKKDSLYRLTDEFSLFFLKFMNSRGNINWQQLSNTQSYKAWSGFAFENVCLKHGDKLKEALGIAGVFTEISAFYFKGDRYLDGTQIDLVIDRNDNVINVCEVKFYDKPFTLTKAYAHNLRQKLAIFQEKTKTRKTVFLTLITVFGIIPSMHSTGFVQQEVLADSLF